jgi:hypothetical protein
MTNVDPESGRKTEVHACLSHAGNSGLSADMVQTMTQKMESMRQAMDALQAFVASERRTPTLEEFRAMGLVGTVLPADANDPPSQMTLEQLRRMAQMMLEESPDLPQP